MLCRFTRLRGSRIIALDGEAGRVRDLYFDDLTWMVRYLIVDAGGWLSSREELISPRAIDLMDHALRTVSVSLTRERITGALAINTHGSVSSHHEIEFRQRPELNGRQPARDVPAVTHLRSARQMLGYALKAVDGRVGRVKDCFVDDETWGIRYLVVRAGGGLLGRRVLVSRDCLHHLDPSARSVETSQTRDQIEHGREFDADNPPPGDLARRLSGEPADSPGHGVPIVK